MNKRLVWLSPIALAVLLSGCSITVTSGPTAPSSLVGYTLAFTHSKQEGVLPADSEAFHFKSRTVAFNASLDKAGSWTYVRDRHGTATVSLIFADSNSAALKITCDLTFDSLLDGTHECDYVHSATFVFLEFTSMGSSEGTFSIREIGSTGP